VQEHACQSCTKALNEIKEFLANQNLKKTFKRDKEIVGCE